MTRAGLPLALAFVILAFSANSLITRHVVERDLLDPGLLSAVRFIAGAIVLAAAALIVRGRRALRVERRHALAAAALGAYAFLISYGYRFIPASAGTLVFYAAVFVTLAASEAAATRRAPAATRMVGAGLALAGLALLALARLADVTLLGVALLAGTGIAWGLYTAAGRSSRDPLAFSAANFGLLALALLLPTGLAAGGALGGPPRVTGEGLAWAVAMGAGTSALAYVAWYWCLQRISGTEAGLYQLAIPIVTAMGAALLLGEAITPRLLVAGALVVAGLAVGSLAQDLTQRARKPRAARAKR